MTSSEQPRGAPVRRPRRAVRHAGTVGGDDANLVSVHPSLDATPPDAVASGRAAPGAGVADGSALDGAVGDPRAPSVREEVPPAVPHDPVVATRSADDSDVGWGDRATDSNDDRLHQDKPPHW